MPRRYRKPSNKSEQLDSTDRPANTDRSDRPDQPGQSRQSDRTNRPARPDQSGQPRQSNRTNRPARPDQPGQPKQSNRTNQSNRPYRPGRTNRIYRPDGSDQPDRTDRPDRHDRIFQPDASDQPDQTDRVDRPDRPDLPNRLETPVLHTRSVRPDRRERLGAGRQDRAGRFDRFNRFDRQPPSTPIRTNRGIKARSQRGSFSKNWWARRWIESMENLVELPRLQRGRVYARSGQVLSLQEVNNAIEARVQGSRPAPYKVAIKVTSLTDEQWDQVIDAMSQQALFTAQLLAGEMPADIEDAFHTAGVSLFPNTAGDLFTECSCPDWANPCKHVAATHYILGDRFDDDPFLLFRMRGRDQDQILQGLRARRAGLEETAEQFVEEEEAPADEILPLEDAIDHFWQAPESLDEFPLTIRPASVDMPLLKRLGDQAFLTGRTLQDVLKPVYDTFMRSALLAAYSEEDPIEPSSENGNGNGSANGNHSEPG